METIKRFERMMKRLRPYLPKPNDPPEPKRLQWVAEVPGAMVWPPQRK